MLLLKSLRFDKYPMHSGEMHEQLGLTAGGHLPDAGMTERVINGVRIYVTAKRSEPGKKSSRHRVVAICPLCHKHMSAGRLNQHGQRVHR